jgi:hypothetical protein
MGDTINAHMRVVLAGRPEGIRPVIRPIRDHTQTVVGSRDR